MRIKKTWFIALRFVTCKGYLLENDKVDSYLGLTLCFFVFLSQKLCLSVQTITQRWLIKLINVYNNF